MLGVTGPNEYENNVNNNWYTNYIARWCLSYTLGCLKELNLNLINPKEIDNWTKKDDTCLTLESIMFMSRTILGIKFSKICMSCSINFNLM